MVIAQIGRAAGNRVRSVRVGDRELHERGNGEFREAGAAPADVTAAEARERAAYLLEHYAPWPDPKKKDQLTEEERRNLRALGYVE